MNEEDIKKFKKELWFNKGFQKGKLEQKKEELEGLKTITELSFICPECESSFVLKNFSLVNRIKQLQKEIGEEKGK